MCQIAERSSSDTAEALSINKSNIMDYVEDVEKRWPDIRKPQCPDGHVSEVCLAVDGDMSMLFEEGDLYVVGIVPVHNVGSSPLQCGDIKSGGLDISEAIREEINKGKSSFKGKIGTIIIDSCDDPQIVQEKVLTLHRHGVYMNGAYVPVGEKILGYVGGWTSDVSTAVARITGRLGYVQIAYGSTATSLSRRTEFPYFMRIPTADNEQAKALLKIVKQLDASVIQIVYSKTIYGEGGRNNVKEFAKTSDICIGNEIAVDNSTTGEELVRQLRTAPDVKIVIIFMAVPHIQNVIAGLNSRLVRHEFLFVASDEWGVRQNMRLYPNLAGVLTVATRLWVPDTFKSTVLPVLPYVYQVKLFQVVYENQYRYSMFANDNQCHSSLNLFYWKALSKSILSC